jgi:hypothetical protein
VWVGEHQRPRRPHGCSEGQQARWMLGEGDRQQASVNSPQVQAWWIPMLELQVNAWPLCDAV